MNDEPEAGPRISLSQAVNLALPESLSEYDAEIFYREATVISFFSGEIDDPEFDPDDAESDAHRAVEKLHSEREKAWRMLR